MLTDLTTAVTQISSEDMEALFAEGPETSNTQVHDSNKQDNSNPRIDGNSSINVPIVENVDDFLGDEGTSGTSGAASTEGTSGTAGEADTSGTSGTAAGADTSGTAGTSGTAATAAQTVETEQVNEVLTNTVKFLVEKGLFKDFEGREDLKLTDEVYADLVEQQIEALVNERYDNKKKSAGEYGEAIIDFIEKGGDADQVIDLFKEQKAIQEFDITDDEAKKELIVKWYKEVHGWKSDRIKKTIDGLEAEDGKLEEEANEIKAKYTANYKAQLQEMREQQEALEQEQAKRQKVFEKSITETISKTKNLDETRKKLIQDSLFKQKKLNDGTVASDLYLKLAQIQTDPAEYVEFAEFVIDKKGYLKRKELEFQTKAVDKKFQFVKGGAAVDRNKGSNHPEADRTNNDSKKYQGTDFRFALKNN